MPWLDPLRCTSSSSGRISSFRWLGILNIMLWIVVVAVVVLSVAAVVVMVVVVVVLLLFALIAPASQVDLQLSNTERDQFLVGLQQSDQHVHL